MEDLALTGAPSTRFWRGKRVLITGHTGFKGAWLTLWLNRLGVDVTGISLPPATAPNLFSEADVGALCHSHFCDIRDAAALAELVRSARPDIVFHLAAQPLVRASYRQPLETYATNVMGTAHVLEVLRGLDAVRVAVMITTDKIYRENEDGRPYGEDDALGGHDPYSASKAACELVIASHRESFLRAQGVAVASARAGNVIGGGDWSDDRLLPDAIRAWQSGRPLEVRRPRAVRPWQHVLEPLGGYLTLAQKLWEQPALADAYNFGPALAAAVPVRELIECARTAYGEGDVRYGDGSEGPREAAWLTLQISKAEQVLGVVPMLSVAQAVQLTMAWYRAHQNGAPARALCEADILSFEQQLRIRSAGVDASSADRKKAG